MKKLFSFTMILAVVIGTYVIGTYAQNQKQQQ